MICIVFKLLYLYITSCPAVSRTTARERDRERERERELVLNMECTMLYTCTSVYIYM